MLLRPGNAGANNAAEQIRVVTDAPAQLSLPGNDSRPGRGPGPENGAGSAHESVDWLSWHRVNYGPPSDICRFRRAVWCWWVEGRGDCATAMHRPAGVACDDKEVIW